MSKSKRRRKKQEVLRGKQGIKSAEELRIEKEKAEILKELKELDDFLLRIN